MKSMRRDQFLKRIDDTGMPFFTTTDAALAAGISPAYASLLLARLAETGFVARVRRGKWYRVGPNEPNRFALATFLAAPHPSYITGPTALHFHGIIDQIPRGFHAAWPLPTKRYRTPLGEFIYHALPNPKREEVEFHETPHGTFRIARPAKALIDTARLAVSARSSVRLFPEIDLTSVLQKAIQKEIRHLESPFVRERVRKLLAV
jgi:predicted transcriptional regulator of viral defense system